MLSGYCECLPSIHVLWEDRGRRPPLARPLSIINLALYAASRPNKPALKGEEESLGDNSLGEDKVDKLRETLEMVVGGGSNAAIGRKPTSADVQHVSGLRSSRCFLPTLLSNVELTLTKTSEEINGSHAFSV